MSNPTEPSFVEILRKAAENTCWPAPQHVKDTLYWLAADEIERLQTALRETGGRLSVLDPKTGKVRIVI